ncbi:MAG: DUF4416 family protein [Candidatus Omnitrophota bacterium]
MGIINKHPPVKLIVGFIFKEDGVLYKARNFLKRKFGEIDYESQTLAFRHTDYYEKEFGKDLKKRLISFKKLICPESLASIKIGTNKIEQKLSHKGLRLINIDPGYLDMAKLVLASAKNYRHRIYLNQGIYAEITLFYENAGFHAWDWTYPDYRTAEYIAIITHLRDIYATQIKDK